MQTQNTDEKRRIEELLEQLTPEQWKDIVNKWFERVEGALTPKQRNLIYQLLAETDYFGHDSELCKQIFGIMYSGDASAIRRMIGHLIKLARWHRSQRFVDYSTFKGFEDLIAKGEADKIPNVSFISGNFASFSPMRNAEQTHNLR